MFPFPFSAKTASLRLVRGVIGPNYSAKPLIFNSSP